jgi:hypothetical protein
MLLFPLKRFMVFLGYERKIVFRVNVLTLFFSLLPQVFFSRLPFSPCNDSRMKTRHKRKIIISRWKISTIIKWSSKHDTATHDAFLWKFLMRTDEETLILMSNFLAPWIGGWLTSTSASSFQKKNDDFSLSKVLN